MTNWKQDPITKNLHMLYIPNGPILELREHNSGYRYKMLYSWHEATENPIKNPTLKVLDEQTYTAKDLNKAKEYAELLAKMTFEKIKNNILIAIKHIDFFTTEPSQDTPTQTNILWTNKITDQEIHEVKAKELLSTETRTDYDIERQLKREAEEDLADLRLKLDPYMLSDYVLIELTEIQTPGCNDIQRTIQQTTHRPWLSEIFNEPNIATLNYTHTYYFENGDLYLLAEDQSNIFSPTKSIFRLMKKQFFSDNTLVMLKDTTIDEFKNMDLITISLEPVIKNALNGLDFIL